MLPNLDNAPTRSGALVKLDSRPAVAVRRARSLIDATLAGIIGHRPEYEPWLPEMSFRHAARDVDVDELLALTRRDGAPRGPINVAVLVHGLFVDEQNWTLGTDPLTDHLQPAFGWTPLLVRFNTGRHISMNGEALADKLVELHDSWGASLGRIQLLGHSMGGLVARSALASLEARGAQVLNRVERLLLLATPNQGADLERIGNAVEISLRRVQMMPGFARRLFGGSDQQKDLLGAVLGRAEDVVTLPVRSVRSLVGLRSDGIRDVRYGYMQRQEWEMDAAWNHRALVSHRRPLPPPPGIKAYAIAGSLWPKAGGKPSRWRNDGLVSVSSAAGFGGEFDDLRVVDQGRFAEIPMLLHQLLPTSERVRTRIAGWLDGT